MNQRRVTLSRFFPLAIVFAAIVLFLGSPAVSRADACTDPPPAGLGGTVVGPECQVNTSVSVSGVYNLTAPPYTLHLCGVAPFSTCVAAGAGILTVPPAPGGNNLTLLIGGNLIMDIGSAIVGDVNTANGIAANINIQVGGQIVLLHGNGTDGARITSNLTAGSCSGGRSGTVTILAGNGDIVMQPGSIVSAGDLAASLKKGGGNKAACPGGDVRMLACNVLIDGKVLSQSALTGTGAVQRPGGGPITLIARCNFVESPTGIISSRGLDPGADLVHVEGACLVNILGLVESTGPGHAIPNSPPNHCDGALRPDKPSNSTACVEVWSGGPLSIDSTGPNNGEINVDTAQAGGHQIAWVDVLAKGAVRIIGDTVGPWVIHANEFVSNSTGGIVRVESQFSSVSTLGRDIQANGGVGPASGGHGGKIEIHAYDDVNFLNNFMQAQGDNLGGGPQGGGSILVHSWNQDVNGTNANLNASGGPPVGSIELHACGLINFLGFTIPAFTAFTGGAECGVVPVPVYFVVPPCFCQPTGVDGIFTCQVD